MPDLKRFLERRRLMVAPSIKRCPVINEDHLVLLGTVELDLGRLRDHLLGEKYRGAMKSMHTRL